MWSITIQMMKKNLRMLIPAGIAILIGTAFIAATLLFSNAFEATLRQQITAEYGGSNYAMAPSAVQGNDASTYNNTIADFHIDQVEKINGVEAVRADVSVPATLSTQSKHATSMALSTSLDAQMLPVKIIQGTAPQPSDADTIAIPQTLADQWGVKVGDTISVNSQVNTDTQEDSSFDVRVVGITDDYYGVYAVWGGASVASDVVLAKLSGINNFNDIPSQKLYLLLNTANAITFDDARAQLIAQLPQGFALKSREVLAQEAIQNMSANGGDVTKQFLLAFGVLGLLVAALVIANTFQVLVAQRRRTLALMRTIGATQRQLYCSVLEEAGILGLVSSVLGVVAGIGIMSVASNSGVSGTLQMRMQLVFTWQVFVIPIAFGVLITILASVSAARTATNVTPLEAMRPLEIAGKQKGRLGRTIVGILCLVVGIIFVIVAIVALQEVSNDVNDIALIAALGGCIFVFLGIILTALVWMPWIMKLVGWVVSLSGPSAKLAAANIQKNPRRIAATGSALLIGVTLVSVIATGAASAKASINQELDTRYSVDAVAVGKSITAETAQKASQVSGVEDSLLAPTAQGVYTDAQGEENHALIVGIPSAQALQKVLNVDVQNMSISTDQVLIPVYDPATGEKITVKDEQITLAEQGEDPTTHEFGDIAQANLRVEQQDFRRIINGQVVFVNEALFTSGTFVQQNNMMLFKLNTNTSTLAQTFESLQKVFEEYSDISLGGPIAERQVWESTVNMMFGLLIALLAVAVIIAIIGVANTLSLSVIERTRESATLRAIGMTRGQLRLSLAVEAIIISCVTSIVGMVIGTLFGWLGISTVLSSIAKVVYPIDWKTYGIILLIAVVSALVASIFPARRAARTAPVEALADA